MSIDKLGELSDDELIKCCNDIYNWKHSSDGVLEQDCTLRKVCKSIDETWVDLRTFEDCVLNEAIKRFRYVAPVLLERYTGVFIK